MRIACLLLITTVLACDDDAPASPEPSPSPETSEVPDAEPATGRTVRYYYKRAAVALGFGLYDAALVDLDLALARAPDHPPSLALRGMLRLDRLLRGLADERKKSDRIPPGILEYPNLGRGRHSLSLAYSNMLDYEQWVAENVRVDPDGEVVGLGDYADRERLKGRINNLLTLAMVNSMQSDNDGPSAEGRTFHGIAQYRFGYVGRAIASLEQATELGAGEMAWAALGLAREKHGDVETAMAAYENALAVGNYDLVRWLRRGVEPETFRWLPDVPGRGLPEGLSEARRAMADAAEVDLDGAIEGDEHNVRAREFRGLLRLLTGRPAEARADLLDVVERQPERARSWYLLARAILADDPSAEGEAKRAWRRSWELDARYLLFFHEASSLEPPDLDQVNHELLGIRW